MLSRPFTPRRLFKCSAQLLMLIAWPAFGLGTATLAAPAAGELGAPDGRIQLQLGGADQGLPLALVQDRKSGRSFTHARRPLWSVELQHAGGEKSTLTSMHTHAA